MAAKLFVEGHEVETFGDIDTEFTYSIANISDIEKRNSSFSKTIIIPATNRNREIFGHIFDISVQNDYLGSNPNVYSNFNPAKKAKALIYLDSVKIFDGIIRMMSISNVNGDIKFETNVFGRLNDILYSLGDKTLNDLDFTNYDHEWNLVQIENSWDREMWTLGGDNYVYPLIDYGMSLDNGFTYPLTQFRPAIFVREILGRMFQEAGFQIIAPFFDTDYFKKLVLIYTDNAPVKSIPLGLNVTSANDGDIINYIDTPLVEDDTIPLSLPTITTGTGWTQMGGGIQYEYNEVTPIDSNLIVNYDISAFHPTNGTIAMTLFVERDRGGLVEIIGTAYGQFNFRYQTPPVYNSRFQGQINTTAQIEQNDIITIKLRTQSLVGGVGIKADLTGTINLILGTDIPVTTPLVEFDTMKMAYILPKSIKQKDFLKSVIQMFNLYIEQDKLIDNALIITPYPLFLDIYKDQAVDWSQKLDTSSEVSITPLSELTFKEYRLKYQEDNDYWNDFYQKKFNMTYGESVSIFDNDFQRDVKEVVIPLGPPMMRDEYGGLIMLSLYKVQNDIKQPSNFRPRIASWKYNGESTPANWQIAYSFFDGAWQYAPQNTYPYAGHLDDPYNATTDLLFGYPREVYFSINPYPNANLFNAFYSGLISEISNIYSRLLKGQFRLLNTDILDLDFRRLIKVGKHFFRLIKVDKYNPVADGLSEVSLLKVLEGLRFSDFDYILLEDGTSYLLQQNGVSKIYI